MSIVAAAFIRNPPSGEKLAKAQPIRFRIGFLNEGLLIAFLTFVSFAGAYDLFSQSQRDAFGIISLVMLAMFLMMVVPKEPQKETSSLNQIFDSAEMNLNESKDVLATIPPDAPADTKKSLNEDPLMVNVLGLDLWLKLIVVVGTLGPSLGVVLPNIDVIFKSLDQNGYTTTKSALYVSMTSVVNALARIGIGMLSYYVEHISLLFLVPPIAIIFSIVTILASPALLPLGFCLTGIAVGSCWASMILLSKATYSRYIGQHYTFLFSALTLTPLPLGYCLFGTLYEREAERQGGSSCYGYTCVSTSLYTLLAIGIMGFVAALSLHIRRRRRASNTQNGVVTDGYAAF